MKLFILIVTETVRIFTTFSFSSHLSDTSKKTEKNLFNFYKNGTIIAYGLIIY